jgi:hypothetical protein
LTRTSDANTLHVNVELLGGAVSVLVLVDVVVSTKVSLFPGGEVVAATGEVSKNVNTSTSVGVIVRNGLEEGACGV